MTAAVLMQQGFTHVWRCSSREEEARRGQEREREEAAGEMVPVREGIGGNL